MSKSNRRHRTKDETSLVEGDSACLNLLDAKVDLNDEKNNDGDSKNNLQIGKDPMHLTNQVIHLPPLEKEKKSSSGGSIGNYTLVRGDSGKLNMKNCHIYMGGGKDNQDLSMLCGRDGKVDMDTCLIYFNQAVHKNNQKVQKELGDMDPKLKKIQNSLGFKRVSGVPTFQSSEKGYFTRVDVGSIAEGSSVKTLLNRQLLRYEDIEVGQHEQTASTIKEMKNYRVCGAPVVQSRSCNRTLSDKARKRSWKESVNSVTIGNSSQREIVEVKNQLFYHVNDLVIHSIFWIDNFPDELDCKDFIPLSIFPRQIFTPANGYVCMQFCTSDKQTYRIGEEKMRFISVMKIAERNFKASTNQIMPVGEKILEKYIDFDYCVYPFGHSEFREPCRVINKCCKDELTDGPDDGSSNVLRQFINLFKPNGKSVAKSRAESSSRGTAGQHSSGNDAPPTLEEEIHAETNKIEVKNLVYYCPRLLLVFSAFWISETNDPREKIKQKGYQECGRVYQVDAKRQTDTVKYQFEAETENYWITRYLNEDIQVSTIQKRKYYEETSRVDPTPDKIMEKYLDFTYKVMIAQNGRDGGSGRIINPERDPREMNAGDRAIYCNIAAAGNSNVSYNSTNGRTNVMMQ